MREGNFGRGVEKTHMNAVWRICLMGGLRAERGEEIVTRFRSQKIGALLAYLALFPHRPHTREELADLFWPDAEPEAARANLRTALSSLRRPLEPPGTPAGAVLVTHGHGDVRLNPASVETDVARFEDALKIAARPATPREEQARLLTEAADLYRGPLLPGLYETWALTERDRLAEAYLDALRRLIACHEQNGDTKAALPFARRAVSADPLSEEAHANVIRLLQAVGDRAGARRQFDELTRLLDERLGGKPSPETRALLEAKPTAAPAARAGLTTPIGPAEERVIVAPPAIVHLPLTLTRFFGREDEMTALTNLLRAPETRLITLTGPGGSGKTRLSIETARRLTDHFTGGIWFVALADLRDPERVGDAIADALRLPRSPGALPLEQVAAALNNVTDANRPALLALDNLEHLIDSGASVVQTLLLRVPHLSCLVTSRQRLLIDGEREFALPPLTTPAPESVRSGALEDLQAVPSVALFVSRAQAARPDFALTPRNAEAVARLCQRLEGIPLALELAAAWAQTLTPAQMLERLERRFDLLVSRRRDAPGRHATLRAAIESSYRLLSPELQRFFAQLALFRGGWTLEAAEAVTDEPNALLYLTELRERSLILAAAEESEEETPREDETAGAVCGIRFRMLETLREFAWEQRGDPACDDRNVRHFDHFLRLALEGEGHLRGGGQKTWLDCLEADHDNLRAALAWSLETQDGSAADGEAALRLAGTLAWFWLIHNHVREGRDWLQRALETKGAANGSAAVRVKALRNAGWLAWRVHDCAAAARLSEEGLILSREVGDVWGTAFCLTTLGMAVHHVGEGERALALLEEAVALARPAGDPWLTGHCLCRLATIRVPQGQMDRAQTQMTEGIALLRACGDLYSVAGALFLLGNLLRASGRSIHEVRPLIEESAAILRALGDGGTLGRATLALGFLAYDQEDYPAARDHFDKALLRCREAGDQFGAAHSLHNRAHVGLREGSFASAHADFAESLRLFHELGYHGDMALSLEGVAHLAIAQKQWEQAATLLAASNALRDAARVPPSAGERTRLDQDIAAARSALGEARFAGAWESGSALSPDQAVEEAGRARPSPGPT